MKNPKMSFISLRSAVLDIVGYFKEQFESRDVKFYEEEYGAEKILSSAHIFERSHGYDFNFSNQYDSKKEMAAEIKIVYFPNGGNSMLKFIWMTKVDGKLKFLYSKTELFPQEKLTEPRLLDLMSGFLRNEITPDRISRQDFLYKIQNALK